MSAPQRSPGPETTPHSPSNRVSIPQQAALTPEVTMDEPGVSPPAPSRNTLPTPMIPDDPEVAPTGLARHASFVCPPDSQEPEWVPAHMPSWTLGPQHGDHLHTAAPYLIAVPGGHQWEKLLASFVTFESISQHVSRFSYQSIYAAH